jgi:hypothetical protein
LAIDSSFKKCCPRCFLAFTFSMVIARHEAISLIFSLVFDTKLLLKKALSRKGYLEIISRKDTKSQRCFVLIIIFCLFHAQIFIYRKKLYYFGFPHPRERRRIMIVFYLLMNYQRYVFPAQAGIQSIIPAFC